MLLLERDDLKIDILYFSQDDVKGELYSHWLEHAVQSMEPNSALVMDNAS